MEDEFITPMLSAAIAMYEMYQNLVKAGFTERQALLIIAELVKGQSGH